MLGSSTVEDVASFRPVPAPPPRPSRAEIVASFASRGQAFDGAPRPPAHVVVRPQSAYVATASGRRPRSPDGQVARQRPSTARASISPRALPSPRSVPPPAADSAPVAASSSTPAIAGSTRDSSGVTATLRGRRPLTAGARLLDHRKDFKTEMANFTATAAAARASNPEVGPLKYDTEAAWRKTQPRTPRCPFTTSSRLGILNADEVEAIESAEKEKVRNIAKASADGQAAAASPRAARARPRSARCEHRPGKGHWLDGMATGSTIAGCYNRYTVQVPGVAAYNIARAGDFCRAATQRCVMGTAPRFPGEKRVVPPSSPRAASKSPRASPRGVSASDPTRPPRPTAAAS